ncbi:MAG: cystathionine gamma-synthase family protein [Alphaproteobacteria bacterium]
MHNKPKTYRKTAVAGKPLHPETMMMGYGYDPHLSEGSLKIPVFQTSTFVFKTAQDGKDFFALNSGREARPDAEPGLIYSRMNNPDLEVLEDRLALWENSEAGLVFSSGMSAISTTLWTFLRPGDVVIYSAPIYGGTQGLIQKTLPQFGIHAEGFLGIGSAQRFLDAVERGKAKGRIAAIMVETPANPTNGLVDLALCAETADRLGQEHGHRPPVIVDNTFLGPLWQRPLEHGCDLVVYSLTKYVGGHSDLVAGACLGSKEMLWPVRRMRTGLGTMADPHTGWLVMRSLETLKLRMTAAMKNARQVAEFLQDHPKVARVHYLGFLEKNDPNYGLYNKQCSSPGSTFSFEIHGTEEDAFKVLDRLEVIKLAVSLGGTETLISHPYSTTHSDLGADTLAEIGITQAMMRISVGVEHPSDLIADLEQALRAM